LQVRRTISAEPFDPAICRNSNDGIKCRMCDFVRNEIFGLIHFQQPESGIFPVPVIAAMLASED
jgi:hypothetical protein